MAKRKYERPPKKFLYSDFEEMLENIDLTITFEILWHIMYCVECDFDEARIFQLEKPDEIVEFIMKRDEWPSALDECIKNFVLYEYYEVAGVAKKIKDAL